MSLALSALSSSTQRSTVKPEQQGTAFVPTLGADREKIFSRQENRMVDPF